MKPRRLASPLSIGPSMVASQPSLSNGPGHAQRRAGPQPEITMKRTQFVSLIVAASTALLVGCASGPSKPAPEILQRIESAQTRADHQWLADYFAQEARKAKDTAVEHRAMGRSYQARMGAERGAASMVAHCNAVVTSYESIATDYERMSTAHKQFAAEAKQ